jgi:ABC-type nitrate/sulfonate/bicarbonate transport system substrate-binding protein
LKNRKRFLSLAVAGLAFFALFSSTLFVIARRGSKEPTDPPEKVTIAVATNLSTVLVKVAETKGFFRHEGLEETLQLHTFGKSALQSLLDGKADFATVAETPIMFAIMKGAKLAILTTIQTSNKDEAIVARKDMGIESTADLKGRRVGVSFGTNGAYFLDSYLIVQGMMRKDVDIVDLKPEEMTDALLHGKVDAVSTWNPIVSNLCKTLGDRGITFYGADIYKETFNIVSSQEFIKQHPETVRRILRALAKAEGFVVDNPEESQEIISNFSGIDKESLSAIWNDFQFNLSLNQSLLFTLEDQARWAIRSGQTDRRDMPNFFESLYLDGLQAVKPKSVRIIR